MKKLKRYNEFFDTEEYKISHDIEILSNVLNPDKVISDFDNQEPYIPLINILNFKYPFFSEVKNSNEYSNLTKSINDTYYFNFKNEQCQVSIGFKKTNPKIYDLSIIYIPEGASIHNGIITFSPLLTIYNNVTVTQIFRNINLKEVYNKIDTVLIPIMKEFGFHYLLNVKKGEYEIRKN